MKRVLAALLLAMAVGAAVQAQFSPDGLFVLPEAVRAYQISSFDKTGGNDDGNRKWAYLSYDRDAGLFTIFDAAGPGTLTRFWMTGWRNPGELLFVEDGDQERYRINVVELFSGTTEPFAGSLVAEETTSSGGFISYVPIPFDERLEIFTASVSRYIQLQFYRFSDELAREREERRAELLRIRDCPLKRIRSTTDLPADSGHVRQIASLTGPGLVENITITLPAGRVTTPETNVFESPLASTFIRITADNVESPQIEAPLSEFFGGTLFGEPLDAVGAAASVRTLPAGQESLELAFRLPIPFASRLIVELVSGDNPSIGPIESTVAFRPVEQIAALFGAGRIGHLYGIHNRTAAFLPGADVSLVDFQGSGRLAGVVLHAASDDPENRRILEGDERIYIDGARTPQFHGTGTEDFFNGGWYYSFGPFSLPTHGNPAHVVTENADHTTQYRYLPSDSIPFYSHLRMTLEHGPENDLAGSFSSTVFLYATTEQRLTLSQEIAVDDFSESGSPIERRLIGIDQPHVVSATEWRGTDAHAFTVAIPADNGGVVLRRLTDATVAQQRAVVRIDGERAGVWSTPFFSPEPGLVNSEFAVSSALTQGKRSIEVEIVPEIEWSTLGYQLYSYRPPAEQRYY
ncbi:MAG: DUF2961 domain-containing protein [Spirochaetota bacterium]